MTARHAHGFDMLAAHGPMPTNLPTPTRRVACAAGLAALVWLIAGLGSASAQTVLLRNVPPGSAVEVAVNGTLVGNATANATGDAKIPLAQGPGAKPQMDANVYVDTCGERRRVVVFDRSQSALFPDTDCGRQEIPGVFVVRQVSTLVINATAQPQPTMMLIQGPYDPNAPPKTWSPLPLGFIVSGGGGYTMTSDAPLYACGTVTGCEGDGSGIGFVGGAEYWLFNWAAAEVSILRPADTHTTGKGTGYTFESNLESSVLMIGGKVGIPGGPMRFYARSGADYHRAFFVNDETIEDTTAIVENTVTNDDGSTTTTETTYTYAGGKNRIDYRTGGWSWYIGGGAEMWFKGRYAVYTEFNMVFLRGSNLDKGEGQMKDKVTMFLAGGRIKLF